MARCVRCGARTTWLYLPDRTPVAVDEDPHPEGTVVAAEGRKAGRFLEPGEAWEGPRYMQHRPTCRPVRRSDGSLV